MNIRKLCLWALIAAAFLITVWNIKENLSGGASLTSDTEINSPSGKQSGEISDSKKYTMDEFNRIKMGMTYDEIKAVLGDGTERDSSGSGEFKTMSYFWKNDDGSNISVIFQGGKVITKAQALLETMDAEVNLAQYNEISTGMTYSQVKSILGRGQLMSQGMVLSSLSDMYEWMNKDGSNIIVNFVDGKVDTKSQFELK